MINYISTIIHSNHPNIFVFKWLIILAIVYFLYMLLRKPQRCGRFEGFTQNEKFILKQNENIYDDFYAQIYDTIHLPSQHNGFELSTIVKMTEPSRQSVFLDIGSGTGYLVNELHNAGYKAYGIDKSQSMVEESEKKYPSCQYKCGDIMDPMMFENLTFSHILCNSFTIYHFQDKTTFFRNCYHWLKPNAYLIIHLVDPDKFDNISPIGKINLTENPNKISNKRITDSIVEFTDFQYKTSYDFNKLEKNIVRKHETFKDNSTGNIRQNEQVYYMEDVETILGIAKEWGFIVKGAVTMEECIDDEYQYLYILERTL